ncbi:hypothetical protein V2W45_1224160, partial [Cenococcum geophilum]
ELYIKLVGVNNWVIIYNLANILNIGKNIVSYRLIKSVLFKTLNNKVERLKKKGYKPKKG